MKYATITDNLLALARRVPWLLAYHAFVVILLLILADLFIGQYLFYRHVVSPQKSLSQTSLPVITFQDKEYELVMAEAAKRQEAFARAGNTASYQNPFK